MSKNSNILQLGLGLGLSVVCLYFAFRNVEIDQVRQVLSEADPRFIILALVSITLNNLAKPARWKMLLGAAGQQVSNWTILLAFLTGQMLNFVIPARIGEVSKVALVGRQGPGHAYVVGTLVVEKLLDMLAYGLLFVLLLAAIPLPEWIRGSGFSFVVFTLLLLLVLGGAVYWGEAITSLSARMTGRFRPAWRIKFLTWLENGLESLQVLRRRGGLLGLALVTAFIWGTALWTNQLVMQALQIDLPWSASLLVLVALQASISIPSVPGKIGVFQAVCVLSLAVFGIPKTEALSYGILLYALVFLPVALLGLLSGWLLRSEGEQGSPPGKSGNPGEDLAPVPEVGMLRKE